MNSKVKSLSALWVVLGIVLLADIASAAGALVSASARGDQVAAQTELGTFLWPSVVLLTVGVIYLIGIVPGRRREILLRRQYGDCVPHWRSERRSRCRSWMLNNVDIYVVTVRPTAFIL